MSGIRGGKVQVKRQLQREKKPGRPAEVALRLRLGNDLAHVCEGTTKAREKTNLKGVGRTNTRHFILGQNSLCSHQLQCKDILTHRTSSPINTLRKVLPSRANRLKAFLNQPNET